MRIALHTGKGGVGKTTISTATAIAAARCGHRTLLLSTDPAHSTADVLDQPIGADPVPVAGVPGLSAVQVDVRARFEQAWSAIRGYLVTVLASSGMAAIEAEELTVLPGAEEIVGLLELERLARSGDFDAIVVDCGPTGETMRLLSLPETLSFYADRLGGGPVRLVRSLTGGLAGLAGRNRSVLPPADVRDALGDLLGRLRAARQLLTEPGTAAIRLVLTPERVVVAEARRLWTALSLHGFAVDAVVVNRVLPADLLTPAYRGLLDSQRRTLAAVQESFHALQVLELEVTATEPVGVEALITAGAALFAGRDPMAVHPTPGRLRTEESDSGYRLRLPLPLVEHGEVELGRSGEELIVTAGAYRRRLTLPSLLRRCDAVGAGFEGDDLVIEFRPDPAQWPAALRIPSGVAG